MSVKNVLYDVPEASAVDIGREFARRVKSILGLTKEEVGFATPYKDFTHTHMAEINEIVTFAISTPAGLKVSHLDRQSIQQQLRTQQCWQEKFSVIQWPRHLDYMRIIDENQKLWKFAWRDMLPKQQPTLIDSHQDVRIFQRAKIASLLAEKENHSLELEKSKGRRFRGLAEYLLGKEDRMIRPFEYQEFTDMDKKFHEKIGRRYPIKMMYQPWKGAAHPKNHSAKRARSRSRSQSRGRASRGSSVSPMRRKLQRMNRYRNQQSASNSMINMKMDRGSQQNTSMASTADVTRNSLNQSNLDASIAETTILSGMSQASSHTASLQNDKNVSFNVTGKIKRRYRS